jgi:sugar phosphate isomerase/epimerase
MRAGVSSFAFGWAVAHASPPMDELALLDVARRHGLAVVQLGDNLPAHAFSPERLDAFVAAASAHAIDVELGARGLTDTHLERYVALCRQAGTRLLRFVIDGPGYEPPVRDVRALAREAVPVLEAAGVTLAIENHDRFPARVLRALVDEVGSPFIGICLDTANSLGAGEGLEYVTALLAPITVNLHVKDVAITRLPHQMGFLVEGRALGEGMLAIPRTIERVAAEGRCASVILEGWSSPAAELADTLRIEAARAEQSVQTLKRWLGA